MNGYSLRSFILGAKMNGQEQNKILAIELRKWLSQSRFQSIAKFARNLGVKERTMGDYFLGRSFPEGERRQL